MQDQNPMPQDDQMPAGDMPAEGADQTEGGETTPEEGAGEGQAM